MRERGMLESHVAGLAVRRGKVRDVYELGEGKLLIVATDRISAFDVIMPTAIVGKGRILTGMSNWWFGFFEREIGGFRHHLLETDVRGFGEELEGRSVVVRKTRVVPIECVVRGYLTGSGWKDYQRNGEVSGVKLAAGLRQCEKLPEAIFTPSTKAAAGHDEPISFAAASAEVGEAVMAECLERSIELYTKAAAYALTRGIIIADTKFEFGIGEDGALMLIDEALTPDSSRFWPAEEYEVGREQASFDKQFLRNYLETLAWDKKPPGPELPDDVVEGTADRYRQALARLTGNISP